MRPVLPFDLLPIDEPDKNLVDQARCLKRVIGPFPTHISHGKSVQLAVHQRCKSFKRFGITCIPQAEKTGNVLG